MKKYIFFDIDGTLTNANPGGIVTESTKRALKKLKENDHFVAIATGRSHYLADPFAKENGFEHMVSNGGNALTMNGTLQSLDPLDLEICNEIIDECLQKNIPFAVSLENEPKLYTSYPKKINLPMEVVVIQDLTIDFHNVDQILKVLVFCDEKQESNMRSIHKMKYMRYHQDHLIIEPMDKYKGIEKMVEYVGGNKADIVVFGDGKNDISMMEQAPFSIAMGNAIDEVKQVANYVTAKNTEDGIEKACKYFGWI